MGRQLRLQLAKITGKWVGNFSRSLGYGQGSVLPGRVALLIDPQLIKKSKPFIRKGTIFVTGTNGKSTSTYYIATILKTLGYSVVTNQSGANMVSGVATVMLGLKHPVDYAVFEVDEASVPRICEHIEPDYLVVLNFSRDQLDRYSEIEMLIDKIYRSLSPKKTTLLYNYDNLYAALLGEQYSRSIGYCVLNESPIATIDKPICFLCKKGLLQYILVESIPVLACSDCHGERKQAALVTDYHSGLLRLLNQAIGCDSLELADTLSACTLLCLKLRIPTEHIIHTLERTPPVPAHSMRQEDTSIGSKVKLVLGKNPDSFNRNLRDLIVDRPSQVIIVINNNYADGLDTSWLWDTQFELLKPLNVPIYVSGLAVSDIGLRLNTIGLDPLEVSHGEIQELLRRPMANTTVLANYTAYQEIEQQLGRRKQTGDKNVKIETAGRTAENSV